MSSSSFTTSSSTSTQKKPKGIPIYLNVYDLTWSNDYTRIVGVGAFHSGIVVNGKEWTFGSTESGSGVFSHDPKCAPNCKLHQTILLGHVDKRPHQLEALVASFSRDSAWDGNKYNLVKKNCNHFSNAVSKKILNKEIPAWINRLAYFGSWFEPCIPVSQLKDQTPNSSSSSSTSSSSTSSKFSTTSTSQTSTSNSSFSAFSGKSRKLGAS